MAKNTKNWDRYTEGQTYNERLNPPTNTKYETNWNMFLGNQWINADLKDLPKPVFNIIKRIITYFVASLTSTDIKIKWDSLVMRDNQELDEKAAEILTSEFEQFREDNKFDDQIREILTDAAVTGDMCFHVYMNKDARPYGGKLDIPKFDGETIPIKGMLELEIIEGNRVYFGNPNVRQAQKQPWIQIETRELVKDLKEEYKAIAKEVQADSPSDASDVYDGEIELEGKDSEKVTVLYTYERLKNGNIQLSKDTQNVNLYQADMGITCYPIAWGNWQTQKNQYHGANVVSEVISNQIFINRAFSMAMWNVIQVAFPKLAYDSNRIAKPTNMVGGSLGMDLQPGERVTDVMAYLQPGNMSAQVMQLIDQAMAYTKEVMGISDAALGSVNPEQASGAAIVATQKQAEIPLGNPKAALYSIVEDVANIFCEMTSIMYGIRPVVVNGEDEKYVEEYDFSNLQNALIKNNIDVGASTYWSELSQTQTLDSMFATDKITAIEYFERLPDSYMINKEGILKARKEQEEGAKVDEYEQMAQFLESLPVEEQQRIQSLAPEQQEITIRQLMQTSQLAI